MSLESMYSVELDKSKSVYRIIEMDRINDIKNEGNYSGGITLRFSNSAPAMA